MCELCHHNPCLPGCPNDPDADKLFCSECGEEICGNIGYIETLDGYICEECLEGRSVRELANIMCGGLEYVN